MANKLTQNPIVIDTVMSSAEIATGKFIHVVGWCWEGASNTHTISVKHADGKRFWSATAETGNLGRCCSIKELLDGLFVDTLGGGTLYIYRE